MSYEKDRAICLRRLDFSESSQVLVFFTARHGKQRLIAKGIKRSTRSRFAAAIDLLELGEMVFALRTRPAGSLGLLTEWRQENLFTPLRAHLRRLYCAQYLAEITSELTVDDDPHPAVFQALIAALEQMGAGQDPLGVTVGYQVSLLTEIGLMPLLEACVCCGSASQPHEYFSSFEGGLLCRDCEPHRVEKRQVSPRAVQAISTPRTVPADLQLSAFDLLDYHIAHLAGKPSRLAPLVAPPAQRRILVK